jgi:hypothetical protein
VSNVQLLIAQAAISFNKSIGQSSHSANKHFSVLNTTTVNKSEILTFASVRLHFLSLAMTAHQTQCKLESQLFLQSTNTYEKYQPT